MQYYIKNSISEHTLITFHTLASFSNELIFFIQLFHFTIVRRCGSKPIFASQGFRSRPPLSSPMADWAGISDPRALDFYWMQLLLAASNQIAANNRSRKHHLYAVENVNNGDMKLLKAPIGQKWCNLCRQGLWKPLDGDPRELQDPAQSAKGEEMGDRERNPGLAKMK